MTTAPDFQELLSMDAADALKPPAKPSGTYRVMVDHQESVKSRDKGTPGVQFTFTRWDPQADVDVEAWQKYLDHPTTDKDNISQTDTFWLTRKSMYRLKDFCIACGTPEEGPMSKLVADALQQTVLISVVQTVSRDGQNIYNEIQSYAKDV